MMTSMGEDAEPLLPRDRGAASPFIDYSSISTPAASPQPSTMTPSTSTPTSSLTSSSTPISNEARYQQRQQQQQQQPLQTPTPRTHQQQRKHASMMSIDLNETNSHDSDHDNYDDRLLLSLKEEARARQLSMHGDRPTLLQASAAALKANLLPGLILQAFALCLVLGYYLVPTITEWCDVVADYKEEKGYVFSAISTSIFGGLIPFLFITWKQVYWDKVKSVATSLLAAQAAFYILFFLYKGIEVDTLYRVQAIVFGDGNDVWTIAKKVVVDQFVVNPLYSAPTTAIAFMWKDADFDWTATRQQLGWDLITYRIPCILVSVWIVWIPAVSLIYALPSALQVPLFNLVLCFFVLVLTIVAKS